MTSRETTFLTVGHPWLSLRVSLCHQAIHPALALLLSVLFLSRGRMHFPQGLNLMRTCLWTSGFPPVMGEAEGRRPLHDGWCLSAEDVRSVLNPLAAQCLWEGGGCDNHPKQ